MPVATPFNYVKPFSPGSHCAQDKTTAQLDAINTARHEDASLSAIMALWWNLYTVTLAANDGTSESATSRPFGLSTSSTTTVAQVQALAEATPRNRVCADFTSTNGAFTGISAGNATTSALDMAAGMNRVYYNTTTAKYSLLMYIHVHGTSPSSGYASYNPGGWFTNGGTFTLFGTTIPSWKFALGDPNCTASVSSPAYYTY